MPPDSRMETGRYIYIPICKRVFSRGGVLGLGLPIFGLQSTSSQRNLTRKRSHPKMKGASTGTARAGSGHEGTASDLRGNHTVVTAAPPRSPSGRAVPRRGCTSLEQHEAGAPLTHRSCAASFSARTAGGPPTSSTRMSAWHRTSQVVSRNPLSCCSRSRDQALSQQRGILSPV